MSRSPGFEATDIVGDFEMSAPLSGVPRPARLVHDTRGIALLGAVDKAPAAGVDWDRVHAAVQDALGELTQRVDLERPGSGWRAGRASGRAFPLFSYRVFPRLDDEEDDPVVVGITFIPRGQRIQITGDISAEESGQVYYDDDDGCESTVGPDTDDVVGEAVRIATRLGAQHEVVLCAMRGQRAGVAPRAGGLG